MKAVGIDISLTATGIVCWDAEEEVVCARRLIKTGPHEYLSDDERMWDICWQVLHFLQEHSPELINIEGNAFAQRESRPAELARVVRVKLFEQETPYMLTQPSTLKKWATGNGRASKEDMVEAAVEWDPCIEDHNEADALHLARYAIANS